MKLRSLKNITKKTFILITLICVSLICISVSNFSTVFANEAQPVLQINGSSSVNGNYFIFTNQQGETIGKVGVRLNNLNEYQTPTGNIVSLPQEAVGTRISVDIIPELGYEVNSNIIVDGNNTVLPGAESTRILGVDISSAGQVIILDNIVFQIIGAQENPPSGNIGQPPPFENYPIVAYFEGNPVGVTMDSNGSILMPNNWTTGKVSFKAKICRVGGVIAPDNGLNQFDSNSQEEINVRIEGIANAGQINNTVINNSNDRSFVTINNDFRDYGKVTIHITSVEEGGPVNMIINIITDDLVNIKAKAPLDMSYSVGSSAVDQAIITKDVPKDLSIFFGNTETTLIVSGENVSKITAVNANGNNVVLNNDGSATVSLPDLSVETTTQVKVTILLKNGNSIVRTINIRRTAIMLEYDDRENKLRAGYVMNKAYLYNNQNHNDAIFDAYLQVIYYKDNIVSGYKQIKIDDEAIINNLNNNEAWSIETFSENSIILYDGSVQGINKASVFLTDGPIDFNSNTLPSVEFGIGSGVTVEFGGER